VLLALEGAAAAVAGHYEANPGRFRDDAQLERAMKTAYEVLTTAPWAMPAAEVARQLGIPVEAVYPELVRLEAKGLVRVVVDYSRSLPKRVMAWEPT
jgi:predicted ArsR family transcriptional regulator